MIMISGWWAEMPVYKICRHCGKRYPAHEQCTCKQRERAVQRYRKEHDKTRPPGTSNFYKSKRWYACKEAVYARSAGLDELLVWFWDIQRDGRVQTVFKLSYRADRDIYDGLRALSEQGPVSAFSRGRERLLVHHIVPKEERMEYAYDLRNLVGLTVRTHNFIHEMYDRSEEHKSAMQLYLRRAVDANTHADK